MSDSAVQNSNDTTISETASEAAKKAANTAGEVSRDAAQHFVAEPAKDIFSLMKDYLQEKPDVAAMWCFGLGVIVGWKLKP